ncbi:hypothetical protein O3P69_001092 [Scylla paramamosain]|uniref:Uncharacterized protein n=1 Tax=Scylla paramamosain TaxID=85552 RepID=A0AAW0UNK5_SCYPA
MPFSSQWPCRGTKRQPQRDRGTERQRRNNRQAGRTTLKARIYRHPWPQALTPLLPASTPSPDTRRPFSSPHSSVPSCLHPLTSPLCFLQETPWSWRNLRFSPFCWFCGQVGEGITPKRLIVPTHTLRKAPRTPTRSGDGRERHQGT